MTLRAPTALLMLLSLAACGSVGPLKPAQGASMPTQGYGQSEEQTAERLTTPSPQARLGRSDELLKRSERRADDPFDLPPGAETDVGKKFEDAPVSSPEQPGPSQQR